ncbi:MAG: ferrous iron transport protein B [Candidatus Hydrogenedentes bacterium]|nr:ferrous iron transport protein B [Candidatus Hydrogenedentota bacterium]
MEPESGTSRSVGVVAVVGNPNVGKTTLFNALTGLNQVTGNYPGVTVERKSGQMKAGGCTAQLIDLPGTYSLAARSPDEMIVVDVLLGQQSGEKPVDAVLAVVDATNLERNLYLVSQVKELGKPIVIALNMTDLAEKRQIVVDAETLAREIGAPVVPICAHKRIGIDSLKQAVIEAVCRGRSDSIDGPEYPKALLDEVAALEKELNARRDTLGRPVQNMEAFRLLVDRGGYAEQRLKHRVPDLLGAPLDERRTRVGFNGSLAAVEARSRYAWIRRIVSAGVRKPSTRITTTSDKIDTYLTHKVYGTLLFALLMATVFQAIFAWASPIMDLVDATFGGLGDWVGGHMSDGVLKSLIVDGIIAGVGSVVIFVPQILILTLFVAILEDCGYMARAAFLMDRLLSKCGLSGQSFIPLLSSFACAIPGIMATRTIANRRDRFATILVAPLMSCSARLPVYTVMIAAFIPAHKIAGGLIGLQGLTLFLMYCLGITIAIPVAWIVKKTLLKGDTPPFLLELPSYKLPQWGTVGRKVYTQGREFLWRAGTIILSISIIVWALSYFPHSQSITQEFDQKRAALEHAVMSDTEREEAVKAIDNEESGAHIHNSYLAAMGHAIEPAVAPLGWDWRIGMAAISSFPAREVVIATMGTIFYIGGEVDENSDNLRTVLQTVERPDGTKLFNIPVALSIMVFFALCCQCGATLAIIRRETRSLRWPLFTFAYMTTLAYVGAMVTYHATTWMGWGA